MSRILWALGLAALCVPPALADPVADFYKGKSVQFVIRTTPGTGYDQYGRLLARHIGRHIPGTPNLVPVNMPGGGGIVAANYVGAIAPKDGTVLTLVSQGLPMDQALHMSDALKVDLRQFNWLGNMSNSNQLLVTWKNSPTKTLEDAMKRETTIGSSGAGSVSVQFPAIINNLLGTRFKIIFGYPGGSEIDYAMEQGELDGRGSNTYASYVSSTPYIRDHSINILVQLGMDKDPALPDVPLLRSLGKNAEDRAILDFFSAAVAVGRPIATTPGVPADRVAALRKAFDETLSDPDFLKDAATQKAEIRGMSGAVLAKLVSDLIDAPDAIRAKSKAAMDPKSAAQEIAGGAKAGND
jgi:tripartite-type tricarboxylate transporter receptor subunit TctC